MTSPFCVRVSLLFLSITITGEVLITLPHLCASLLWQILRLRESGHVETNNHMFRSEGRWWCYYSALYTPMLYVLKLNSHAQKEMLSHSLSGHITHCNNYLEPLLLEQLCMRECGKTVLAIGVETLMQSWGNTEGWQSAVADVNVL